MLDSPITTVEGIVDLVTGVWAEWRDTGKKYAEGQTAGVDVRHC